MYPTVWEIHNRDSLHQLHDILIRHIKVPYPYEKFVVVCYNNSAKRPKRRNLRVPGPVIL